ncbi:hypothetical protein OG562_37465 [Streptomyces sp. NBC_01275]|uniref:hypothetical protein n=1 Tax=Streptomyces sp. NBC_01275 TaxID=2903807 RepID=UPI00224DB447|nr:hypothetical protein [Streptomyces sp. NBC_01275]MCX4766566.1 hypothetical protein [Streptomyces sp. NBC_01275]
MIVHSGSVSSVLFGSDGDQATVRCLARRGMLHSECEAFDEVRLAPGTRWALTGRDGAEAAWYVLRGTVRTDGRPVPLTAGALVLAPQAGRTHLTAGRGGARLLCLTLGPAAVTRALPPRTPSTATPDRPRHPHNSLKEYRT